MYNYIISLIFIV